MGFGINVQTQRFAGLAIAGTGLELRAIGHDHVDLMVFRVDTALHRVISLRGSPMPTGRIEGGRIASPFPSMQSPFCAWPVIEPCSKVLWP
ncbi:Hypothetical protein GbCGDNIH9_8555 [Granulibacter bethesdensis]|uniref:Uncharacterized protein n=1 Tax=Granulibacter bethesdensis TaxID=364410 RepID=A0AAC9KAB7_9PROT|nr:Hypothetical protein GbCGDNIH9_8555 [Granulibacter bethesdensis]APH62243.1 Hypothetical protein GbCGDNIH8_8555 [Granulibacter bethesdensis]